MRNYKIILAKVWIALIALAVFAFVTWAMIQAGPITQVAYVIILICAVLTLWAGEQLI